MRYSIKPKDRKYVGRYDFLSFAKIFDNKYGEKLIDAANTASKRVVQKTAEATEYLIGNKIANEITPAGKTNKNTKEAQ